MGDNVLVTISIEAENLASEQIAALQATLDGLTGSAAAASSALDTVTGSMASFDAAAAGANGALDGVTASLADADASIASLGASYDAAAASVTGAAGEITAANADIAASSATMATGMDAASIQAAASFTGASELASVAGASMFSASTLGVAALAAIGLGATKMGIDFQTATTQVGNNANMTSAQIDQMRSSIMQLSTQSGSSLNDLAQGYMHVYDIAGNATAAQAELSVANEAAVATGDSAASVANLLANAMHEYGMDTSNATTAQGQFNQIQANAAQTMGIMHLAAAESNLTMQQFSDNAGRAIATAANLGVPLTQVSAAMATLSKHGYDAAQAQTQLVAIFTHMVKPAAAAEKELERLSALTGVDLVDDFSAAGLQAKGLTGVMADLQQAYGDLGLSNADATEETMKLLNAQRGGLGMATLLGTGYSDYNRILGDLNNTQLTSTITEQQYQRELQTTGQQLDILKANAKDALTELGGLGSGLIGQAAVGLNRLADGARAVGSAFSDLDPHIQAVVKDSAKLTLLNVLFPGLAQLELLSKGVGSALDTVKSKLDPQPWYDTAAGVNQMLANVQQANVAIPEAADGISHMGGAAEQMSQGVYTGVQGIASMTNNLIAMQGPGDQVAAMMANVKLQTQLATQAAEGWAAVQNVVDANTQQASGAVSQWQSKLNDAQAALTDLQDKQQSGIPLSDQEKQQYSDLTWYVNRLQGGLTNDLIPAYVQSQDQEAKLMKQQDDLSQAVKDGKISQDQYNQAVANMAAQADPAIAASQALAKTQADTAAIVQTEIDKVTKLAQQLGLIPPDKTTQVSAPGADTADQQIQTLNSDIANTPKSFTITPVVNINPAVEGLAAIDSMLPHSPAKTGPLSKAPNWSALFKDLYPAAQTATTQASSALSKLGTTAHTAGTSVSTQVASGISSAQDSAAQAAANLVSTVTSALKSLEDFGTQSANLPADFQMPSLALVQQLVAFGQQAEQAFAGLSLSSTAATNLQNVTGAVKNAVDAISSTADLIGKLGGIDPSEIGQKLLGLIGGLKLVGETAVVKLGEMEPVYSGAMLTGITTVGTAIKDATDGLSAAADFVTKAEGLTPAAINGNLIKTLDALKLVGETAVLKLSEMEPVYSTKLLSGIATVGTAIKDATDALSSTADLVTKLQGLNLDHIGDGLGQTIGALKLVGETAVAKLAEMEPVYTTQLLTGITTVSTAIKNALDALTSVVTFLGDLGNLNLTQLTIPTMDQIGALKLLGEEAVAKLAEMEPVYSGQLLAGIATVGTAIKNALDGLSSIVSFLQSVAAINLDTVTIPTMDQIGKLKLFGEQVVVKLAEMEPVYSDKLLAGISNVSTAIKAGTDALSSVLTLIQNLENDLESGASLTVPTSVLDNLVGFADRTSQAFGQLATKFSTQVTTQATNAGNAIKAAFDTLTSALTFANTANTTAFTSVSNQTIQSLLDLADRVTAGFAQVAAKFSTQTLTQASAAATSVKNVFDALGGVTSFLTSMDKLAQEPDLVNLPQTLLTNLMNMATQLTTAFATAAQEMGGPVLKSAQDFSATIKPVFDALGSMETGINALDQLHQVTQAEVDMFEHDVLMIVQMIKDLDAKAGDALQDALQFEALMQAAAAALQAGEQAFGGSSTSATSASVGGSSSSIVMTSAPLTPGLGYSTGTPGNYINTPTVPNTAPGLPANYNPAGSLPNLPSSPTTVHVQVNVGAATVADQVNTVNLQRTIMRVSA